MMTRAERIALAQERIAHRKQLKAGVVEKKEAPVKKATKSKKTVKAEEPVVEQ